MIKSDPVSIDHPLITDVLFYPSRLSENHVPQIPAGRIERIPVGSDVLGAFWHRPQAPAPTVLFFHGNGEVMTDYLYDYHRRIFEAGANFLVVDYRGYGLSTGSPCLSGLKEDAHAAWDYAVNSLGLTPGEIIIMGRSLGSLAALELAGGSGQGARALILESAIARFDGWMDRMSPLLAQAGINQIALQKNLREHFDHEKKIKSFHSPVLILHAPHDEIVPVEHARELYSWADPGRTTLKIFFAGGHNDIQLLDRDEYFRTIGSFISGLSG